MKMAKRSARSRTRVSKDNSSENTAFPKLEALANDISERMGQRVMRRATELQKTTVVDTSSLVMDMALLGGFPEGGVSTLVGWEGSGKTTMAIRIAGNMVRKYRGTKATLFIDVEGTYDSVWAAKNGVDGESMWVVQPEGGEQAVDIYYAALQNEEVGCIVVDSLPSLVPMRLAEGSAQDSFVAERSRLVARLADLTHAALPQRRRDSEPVTVILVNQWRANIGAFRGPSNTMTGGNAPKYLASVIMEIKNKPQMGRNERTLEVPTHNIHSFSVRKSKLGNSNTSGEFILVRDENYGMPVGTIDEYSTIVTFAKKFDLMSGGGGHYRCWGNEAEYRKYDDVAAALAENPEWCSALKREILMAHRLDMGLDALPPDGYLSGLHANDV